MPELTSTQVRIAVEIAGIAATPATIEDRAQALLVPLCRAIPCEAAWLAVRDPERRSHTPLATDGDVEALRASFRTPEADDEVELLGLNRHRPPLLAADLPIPRAELRAWADHLTPAGFRGGLAAGLFTRDGRHLGFLSLLTDATDRPTPADCDLIGLLAPLVARAVDRMDTIHGAAMMVRDATAGIVLTRGGRILPLPGLPTHRLLAPAPWCSGWRPPGSSTTVPTRPSCVPPPTVWSVSRPSTAEGGPSTTCGP